jgi:nicotinamidase-related amidase
VPSLRLHSPQRANASETTEGARGLATVAFVSIDLPRRPVPSAPLDLATLVQPGRSALLTVEVQNAVVGEHGVLPALAAAVTASGALERIGALARAARAAGIPVMHCTAEFRPDGLGSNRNARLFAATRKAGAGRPASPGAFDLHEAIAAEPGDLVLPRLHGVSPMTGTSVDPILRNLGVTTIVATGVSVNIALMGLAFEAVNLGYRLVLPRDATAGVDDRYVDAVYEHTLSLVATVTTAAAVIDVWQRAR